MRGFHLAALAFLIIMLGTSLPTPLYPLYEKHFGIAPVWTPVIFAVYAVAVIAGLLFFGRLSDDIGRRKVLFAGLALSAASAIVFLLSNSMAALMAGRALSGLSAGVFTGTATAQLIELAPGNRRSYGAEFAVAMNMGGLGLGTLLSGALASYAVSPLRLPYGVDLALIAAGIVAMFGVPETIERTTDELRIRIARLRVPQQIRRTFWPAAGVGMCGFAVSGLFSAIVPSFIGKVLHQPQPILAGAVVFVLFGATAVGQISVGRVPKQRAFAAACVTLIAGTAALAAAVWFQSIVLTFVSALIEGAGQGLAIGSGLAVINEETARERGEVSSTYFMMLFLALTFPVIGVGMLASAWTMTGSALVFCGIVGIAVAAALPAFLRLHRE